MQNVSNKISEIRLVPFVTVIIAIQEMQRIKLATNNKRNLYLSRSQSAR